MNITHFVHVSQESQQNPCCIWTLHLQSVYVPNCLPLCDSFYIFSSIILHILRHEDVYGNGGIAPRNLILGNTPQSFHPQGTPGIQWMGGWEGPKAVAKKKKKIFPVATGDQVPVFQSVTYSQY